MSQDQMGPKQSGREGFLIGHWTTRSAMHGPAKHEIDAGHFGNCFTVVKELFWRLIGCLERGAVEINGWSRWNLEPG